MKTEKSRRKYRILYGGGDCCGVILLELASEGARVLIKRGGPLRIASRGMCRVFISLPLFFIEPEQPRARSR